MKIANEIYGYSKGATMGKFKHNEDVATAVPPEIIHLDIDLLFVNKIPFFLAKSTEIGFIHCKALLTKHDKRVQNGLRSIVLDYQSMRFKVTSIFKDGAFKPSVKYMRQDLHVDLTTGATDLHVPKAKNAIMFV